MSGVASNATITLASPLPMITQSVAIDGAGATGLTVSGAGAHRVFFAQSGAVTISNLTIADGQARGGSGGNGERGAGGGGPGAGGALFIDASASVTLENVSLQDNAAIGGTGGSGTTGGGNAMGGGGGLGGDGGAGGNGVGGGGGGYLGDGGNGGNTGAAGGGGLLGNGGNGGNSAGGGGGGASTDGITGGNVAGSAGGVANGGQGGDGGLVTGNHGEAGAAGGVGGGGGGGGAGRSVSSGAAGNGGDGGAGGWGAGGGGGASGGASSNFNLGGGGGDGGAGGEFGGGGGAAFGSGSSGDGSGGAGGYGGGGGGAFDDGGEGGFGGGGSGSFSGTSGAGGYAAGNGTNIFDGDQSGGGGAALGGAVFVRDGGSLTLRNSDVTGSSVTGGAAGGSSGATAGQGMGQGLFLHNTTATIEVGSGQTMSVDAIGGIGANDPRNPTAPGGSLVKTGGGTLILNCVSTYGGATTVSGGRLAVNGELLSLVTIGAGGVIGGIGDVGATTVNGTIAAGNSIGQLTVNGAYVQNAGSTMEVEIDAAGTTPGVHSDHVNVVGGSATINGGTLSILAAPGAYADGTVYTFLSASGGVIGAGFDAVIDDLDDFNIVWGVFGNDIRFTLMAAGTNFAATSRTPNEHALATTIDALSYDDTGDWKAAIDGLSLLTGEARWQALNQFGFELLGTQAVVSVQQTGLAVQSLSQQLAMLDAPCCPEHGGIAEEQWLGWVSGFGMGGATPGDGNAGPADYSYGGTSFGAARIMGGVGAIGLFGNYAPSQLIGESLGQSVEMDHLLLGGFVRFNDSVGYWLGAGAGGIDDFDTRRNVSAGGASLMTGDGSGSRAMAYLERGLDFGSCTARLQPYAAVQYAYVKQNDFSASGPLAMTYDDIEYHSLQTVLGTRFDAHLKTSNGFFWNPGLQAAWRHETLESTAVVPFEIDGLAGAVVGADLGRDWAQLGPRVALQLGPSLRTFAGYDVLVNNQQVLHVGSGGVELLW